MTRALLNVPKTAARGAIIEIRALLAHPMETGYREGPNGVRIPRNIIKRFICKYADEEIFAADLFPAVAANPYISFTTIATASGTISFEWIDDQDEVQTASAEITVT